MDTETAKTIFPLLGGALALAGGVFTFVSGRLKEAETPDQRKRVEKLILEWLSVSMNIAGLAVSLIFKGYLLSIVFFGVALLLQIIIFLGRDSNVSRGEIVSFCLMCCMFTLVVACGVTFHFADRTLDLIEKLTGR